MTGKIPCATVLAEIARRLDKIAKHEAGIRDVKSRCAHETTAVRHDYQDVRAYTVCAGCGKGMP